MGDGALATAFYGPGTGFDEGWISRAAAGKLRLPAEPDTFVTLVHIADMAAATAAAIARWPSRRTLTVCDDEPVTWRQLFGHITESFGAPPPQEGTTPGFPSFRASNAEVREVLDRTPADLTFRVGLAR